MTVDSKKLLLVSARSQNTLQKLQKTIIQTSKTLKKLSKNPQKTLKKTQKTIIKSKKFTKNPLKPDRFCYMTAKFR
jgi:DNA-binding transcriptional regulator/RsmH inhibitor MraZ